MKYSEQIKDCKNVGELFDIARNITDKQEATQFFNDYVDYIIQENQWSKEEAIKTAHSNLGYFAGYYSDEVQDHILEMYGSAHPIFGTTKLSEKEAFELGKQMGSR